MRGLKQSQPGTIICMVYEQPAIDGRSIAAETNKKLPCVLQLELSSLREVDAAL